MFLSPYHLAYSTNIHPAENFEDTQQNLELYTLGLKQKLIEAQLLDSSSPFGIGLRLSARVAQELNHPEPIEKFRAWLQQHNCYLFTINGFPYGDFHHVSVKENVYRPDWTTLERQDYTHNLFEILAKLSPKHTESSVSTLPGSFKKFHANTDLIQQHLIQTALFLEDLSQKHQKDFHLGLEPEPLGHFENTEETLDFFQQLFQSAKADKSLVSQRIGVNYDTCHFAIQYDNCAQTLDAFQNESIRLSKFHISNAISLNPHDHLSLEKITEFDEPTYLHQVIAKFKNGKLQRYLDLDKVLSDPQAQLAEEWRVHFHIPLYQQPTPPLNNTSFHIRQWADYYQKHPEICSHIELETYTWEVLPSDLKTSVENQLFHEYQWFLKLMTS